MVAWNLKTWEYAFRPDQTMGIFVEATGPTIMQGEWRSSPTREWESNLIYSLTRLTTQSRWMELSIAAGLRLHEGLKLTLTLH